jgi:pyruvate-formate lyase-activating enzyme
MPDWAQDSALRETVGEPQLREEHDELLSRAYAEARRPYLETVAPIPAHAFQLLSWRYFVEINSGCNLRCSMCIRGDWQGYEHTHGFMGPGLYEQILDKIQQENNKADVCLYGNSEPFLHPRLPQCVAAVKQRGLTCLVSTNLMVVRNLRETLETQPDALIVSVSGFTQEVYGRAHRGGDIELVKTNMQALAKARAEIGSTVPVLVHYHLYRDNWGDEFERMRAFATDLGFTLTLSWARSISMEKTIQYLRLRERQTCGSVPPLQVSAAGLGPQHDWASLFPEVTPDFLNDVERLGITPDEASALYTHYPEPAVCPVGDLFTYIRHDGSVALCACLSDNRLSVAPDFLEVSQEQLSRRRRWHSLCRECLRYKMHMYFHIVDIPMWDRVMAEKFPNIPADRRKF